MVVLLENLGLVVGGVVALALALAVVVGVLAVVGGGLQPAGAADALLAAAVVFAHDPHWLQLLANPFGILNETLLVKAIFEKYSLKGDAFKEKPIQKLKWARKGHWLKFCKRYKALKLFDRQSTTTIYSSIAVECFTQFQTFGVDEPTARFHVRHRISCEQPLNVECMRVTISL